LASHIRVLITLCDFFSNLLYHTHARAARHNTILVISVKYRFAHQHFNVKKLYVIWWKSTSNSVRLFVFVNKPITFIHRVWAVCNNIKDNILFLYWLRSLYRSHGLRRVTVVPR